MGMLHRSCSLDGCYAEVQEVEVGSNIVQFNIRNIPVKSHDQLLAVSEKGLNIFMSIHNNVLYACKR